MKKELRPFHDHVTCDVCGRTILKGERTESYLAPGGERHGVCELCFVRAEHAGWIREAAHDQLPARGPRPPERRPLLDRLRRRSEPAPPPEPEPPPVEEEPPVEAEARARAAAAARASARVTRATCAPCPPRPT